MLATAVRKLDITDREIIKSFDCGDPDLNGYLRRYAIKNQERHLVGTTYVATSPEIRGRVLGYHTVANSSIPRERMPENLLQNLPKYADIPAILLARFAVDREFAGQGIGHTLMSHALYTALLASHLTAARFVLTEAYDSAVRWYEKYDFRLIAGGNQNRRKMFLDLKAVKRALQIASRG